MLYLFMILICFLFDFFLLFLLTSFYSDLRFYILSLGDP